MVDPFATISRLVFKASRLRESLSRVRTGTSNEGEPCWCPEGWNHRTREAHHPDCAYARKVWQETAP